MAPSKRRWRNFTTSSGKRPDQTRCSDSISTSGWGGIGRCRAYRMDMEVLVKVAAAARCQPRRKTADAFKPGGPEKLVDGGDGGQPVSGAVQDAGVAGQCGRVATDIDHDRHAGGGNLADLGRCTTMRRVQHDGGERTEFLGRQRLPREVALNGLDPSGMAALVDCLPQCGHRRRIAFEGSDPNHGRPARRSACHTLHRVRRPGSCR